MEKPHNEAETIAVRTTRLNSVLKKALDCSLGNTKKLKMKPLQGMDGESSMSVDWDTMTAEGQKALYKVRQEVEEMFEILCQRNDLNAKFVDMEYRLAHPEDPFGMKKATEAMDVIEPEPKGMQSNEMADGPLCSPDEIVAAHRQRVKLDEKERIKKMLTALREENANLEETLLQMENDSNEKIDRVQKQLDCLEQANSYFENNPILLQTE